MVPQLDKRNNGTAEKSRSGRNDAHEFRPILAEIEDEPMNPAANSIFWLTFTTVVFFLVWSIWGEVDVVVTAPGKVIPEGHAKILQPLETGIVAQILVKEGDLVRKGQPLLEIDPSMTTDELEANSRNYRYTRLEINRIKSALAGNGFASGGADGEAAAAQRQLYNSSRTALEKQLESKNKELQKTKEQEKETEAELEKNQKLLATAQQKHERLEPVIDLIPRDDWDRNESDIATYRGNIAQSEHRIKEYVHQEEQLHSDIAKIQADFETSNLQDLGQKQKDAIALDGKVRELSFKRRKQTLVAPVTGYVNTLFVHTVGGVVTPAEKLLSIVPAEQHLLVQTSVSNHDIGFVSAGMAAQLKIDTFDFQKYGMFEGKVSLIARDSHDNEAKQRTGGEGTQTEQKLDQVYEVYITPTTHSISVDGTEQPLTPGMTLTAEIKVGKRRIIEFFVYPLIKYWHDGISIR